MTVFVLMGVSGSGKTTVGARVAQALKMPFIEGDDYHPAANVAKMSAGVALTDADRGPWIDALVAAVNARDDADVIVACSALSRFVRDRLRTQIDDAVEVIWLTARRAVIEARLNERGPHFMKAGMTASQLAALETPTNAHRVDVEHGLADAVHDTALLIRRLRSAETE